MGASESRVQHKSRKQLALDENSKRTLKAQESNKQLEINVNSFNNKKNLLNPWYRLPDELIVHILRHVQDPKTFYSVALACKRISNLSQDEFLQRELKLRFCKKFSSLFNLVLEPGSERVFIRHYQTLPCGWRYGEETVWNHGVQLQLVIREGGLCLQGLIDMEDKRQTSRRYWNDNHMVGEERSYYLNGNLQFVRYWNENNQLDGEEKIWYFNGNVKAHNFRLNGCLEGVQQAWYENGAHCFVRLWKNGQLEGTEKQWNINGKLIVNTEWRNGKKKDLLRTSSSSGKRRFKLSRSSKKSSSSNIVETIDEINNNLNRENNDHPNGNHHNINNNRDNNANNDDDDPNH